MKHVKTLVKQMILDNIDISVAICLIIILQLCNSWPLFTIVAANKSEFRIIIQCIWNFALDFYILYHCVTSVLH